MTNKETVQVEAILVHFGLEESKSIEELFTRALKLWQELSKSERRILSVALSMLLDEENVNKIMTDWNRRNQNIVKLLGYDASETEEEEEYCDLDW